MFLIRSKDTNFFATGKTRPMRPQQMKIQKALHWLGEELLEVEL